MWTRESKMNKYYPTYVLDNYLANYVVLDAKKTILWMNQYLF